MLSDFELEHGLDEVRARIAGALARTSIHRQTGRFSAILGGGKLLRSRLILSVGAVSDLPRIHLVQAGAAVEMLHAASLLHDDIVDGGTRRRGEQALWVSEGIRAAVLLGDMLVSLAADEIQASVPSRVNLLIAALREMCDAEAEQEFAGQDTVPTWDQCVSIAGRKTGSLFGFAAACAGGSLDARVDALRRAGYALGTAYQLADDLLDACQDPMAADKTLGTDAATGKSTAATVRPSDGKDPREHIAALLQASEDELAAWPEFQHAWRGYVHEAVTPVLTGFTGCSCSGMPV